MSDRSKIEWTDATWNPVRGCSRVSEGCRNCYAERQLARFSGPGQYAHGFVERTPGGPRWTGRVELIEEKLSLPLRWRSPRRVFVNSTSDLFHELLSCEAIERILGVVRDCPQHDFQVLTKRPRRAREVLTQRGMEARVLRRSAFGGPRPWPLPNLWLGVSVEDQATADERIPTLLETPAAVRFVSAEPLLGPTDLMVWENKGHPEPSIDWVIVGGESGPGARPCDVAWIRSIVAECRAAAVPAFVKQLGADPRWYPAREIQIVGGPMDGGSFTAQTIYDPDDQRDFRILSDRKGGDPGEWPPDLRVRELPRPRR